MAHGLRLMALPFSTVLRLRVRVHEGGSDRDMREGAEVS